ncbi:hypothetical protein [Cupriavidus basilensis]|uniref:SWIM-type domain-containing protein n=1 Tax=Cupriavidus basilensis TaxID=68895 RepID=A0A643FSA5_9BURK|nr:hypothetical protein [Cupriavidus basilensis]QOT80625.1 hypothetical protein F7R26_024665 [Cupriavidus basilensis]
MAGGKAPELAQDADSPLHAAYADGTRTSLAAGRALRDAVCSCMASRLCCHRILLVLVLTCRDVASVEEGSGQTPVTTPEGLAGGPWSPADFDDAARQAALRPATLPDALKRYRIAQRQVPAGRLVSEQSIAFVTKLRRLPAM